MQHRFQSLLIACRRKIRRCIDTNPSLLFPLMRYFFGLKDALVSSSTELVIEGFPRCANSFACAAFQFAQSPRRGKLAHHIHMPAQIIAAAKNNIPCIVVIRCPEDACSSYVLLHKKIDITESLREYIHFYKSIERYHSSYVVAEFHDVVNDFGEIIHKVNEKFYANFKEFHHTRHNVDAVFEIIRKQNMNLYNGDATLLSIPSSDKEKLKVEIKKQFDSTTNMKLLFEAAQVYQRFLQYK